jgi:hypothetical protein
MNTDRLKELGNAAIVERKNNGAETDAYNALIADIDEEAKWLRARNPKLFWQLADVEYQVLTQQWARSREIRTLLSKRN